MNLITLRRRFWVILILFAIALVSVFAFEKLPIPTPPLALISTLTPTPFSVSAIGGNEIVVYPVRFDGFLLNPGMGWQADNSANSQYFPESVAYVDREKITWKKLNPAENIYDWTILSDEIARSVSQGKQSSLRVFTMSGESYGGHQIPDWILQKGAALFHNGEPDYSNCTYQQEWGKFVTALLEQYDGNPSIAFIDISGYGDFNEWGWGDQTEWEFLWDENYKKDSASSFTLRTLDGQARRRLADMFIGGSFSSHQCRDAAGQVLSTEYAYKGAQKTQLVMPYAGISQSTQYVFLKRKDVGFRYDCLGRQDDLPDELSEIWRNAPVIYELCSSDEFDADVARVAIQTTHPILIHNNDYHQSLDVLLELMTPVGYRFFLKEIKFTPIFRVNSKPVLEMTWQNLGTSIPYEKMGQHLSLHLYLVRQFTDQVVFETVATDTDPAVWLPSDPILSVMPADYKVNVSFFIPDTISAGEYSLEVALLDERTGMPVQLAMDGLNGAGRHHLSVIKIVP